MLKLTFGAAAHVTRHSLLPSAAKTTAASALSAATLEAAAGSFMLCLALTSALPCKAGVTVATVACLPLQGSSAACDHPSAAVQLMLYVRG